jgi:hypothetical protein
VFRPSDPKLMFMTAAQDAPGTWRTSHFAGARISRSTDGGRSWEILRNGLPDRLQASIEAFCRRRRELLLPRQPLPAGILLEDLGEHWKKLSAAYRRSPGRTLQEFVAA